MYIKICVRNYVYLPKHIFIIINIYLCNYPYTHICIIPMHIFIILDIYLRNYVYMHNYAIAHYAYLHYKSWWVQRCIHMLQKGSYLSQNIFHGAKTSFGCLSLNPRSQKAFSGISFLLLKVLAFAALVSAAQNTFLISLFYYIFN